MLRFSHRRHVDVVPPSSTVMELSSERSDNVPGTGPGQFPRRPTQRGTPGGQEALQKDDVGRHGALVGRKCGQGLADAL